MLLFKQFIKLLKPATVPFLEDEMENELMVLFWRLWLIVGTFTAFGVFYYQVEHNGSSIKEEILLGAKFYLVLVAAGFFSALFFLPLALIGSLPPARHSREMEVLRRVAEEWELPMGKVMEHLSTPGWRAVHGYEKLVSVPAGRPVELFDAGVEGAKRESRFALAYGALMAFIVAPFSAARAEPSASRTSGPDVHGSLVTDLDPDKMKVVSAKACVHGTGPRFTGYAVEFEAATGTLTRSVVSIAPHRLANITAGRDLTVYGNVLPPPHKRSFCNAPAAANEFIVIAPTGIAVSSNPTDRIGITGHVLRDGAGDRRVVGSVRLVPFAGTEAYCIADYANDGGRYFAGGTAKVGSATFRGGAIHAPRGTSSYVQALYALRPWLELDVQGERSPLIPDGNRGTIGANCLLEGARFRASVANGLGVSAQLTYTF